MATSSSSRRRMGLWVAFMTVLLTCVVIEIGFRVYMFRFASRDRVIKWMRFDDIPRDALRIISHPYLSYSLNPEFRSLDGRDRHNAHGFRGADIDAIKPEGVVRVACLGGSSTYDTEIDDSSLAFPAQLERVLRDEYGRADVEVVNCGVPGYASWESLVNLQFKVLPLDPDLVIVYHATNDVHTRLVPPEQYRPDNSGYRKSWTQDLRWWDHSLVLHAIGVQAGFSQRNNVPGWVRVGEGRAPRDKREAWLDANPPRYFRDNLENIAVLARHRGADVLLTSWAYSPHEDDYAAEAAYQRGFREHNTVSREVAAKLSLPFFDFAQVMPLDDELWDDGRHNTAAGARRKAELFAAFLVDRNLL